MIIKVNYNYLLKALTKLQLVAEDVELSDDYKNIIFSVTPENKVTLTGVNRLITYRTPLDKDQYSVTLNEGETPLTDTYYFQLKSKELIGFLGSYRQVQGTEAEEVSLDVTDDFINVIVLETEKDKDGNIIRSHTSNWKFLNIELKKATLVNVNLEATGIGDTNIDVVDGSNIDITDVANANVISVEPDDIYQYTNTLNVVMSDVNNAYGKMVFSEDHVIAFNKAFTSIMKKTLNKDVFTNLCFFYKEINFINKILYKEAKEQNTKIKIGKLENHIYFKVGNEEIFMVYTTDIPSFERFIDTYNNETYMQISRTSLKNALLHLSLIKDEPILVNIDCNNELITVTNSKFTEEIHIVESGGNIKNYDNVKFRIAVDTFKNAILGSDSEYSNELRICIVDKPAFMLIFEDSDKMWYSVVKVKQVE